MNPTLRWVPSPLASCLHTAELVSRQALAPTAGNYESFTQEVHNWLAEVDRGVDSRANFWRHLLPLAAQPKSRRELIDVVLRKTGANGPNREQTIERILAPLGAMEAAYGEIHPTLETELPNRVLPIQQQWEARGPGLWFALKRQVPEEILVESADVVLVHPECGGGGRPQLLYNSVRLEGVLYHPHPELPEPVRLAWLLAQLELDRPAISETVNRDRLEMIAGLALLPPILEAAYQAELVAPPEESMPAALRLWNLLPAGSSLDAETLAAWWRAKDTRDTPWHIALAALDRMIDP
ncbi:MAG: hypothetical protein WD045_08290 [Pirellulaceae bacterium]